MVQVLPILKVVAELIPILGNIFAIFRRKKAQKRAEKATKVLETVVKGVQIYRDSEGKTVGDKLKDVIKSESIKADVEDYLFRVVKKVTK